MSKEAEVTKAEELNAKISLICDNSQDFGYEAFGGKSIPYIGWFWRHVDFDDEILGFGLIPTRESQIVEATKADGEDIPTDTYKVGFMENNKWGYAHISATAEESSSIKSLLEAAVANPNSETLKAADDAIQAVRLNWIVTKEERMIGGKYEFTEYNARRKD